MGSAFGKGKYIGSDNSSYVGDYNDNNFHGKGVYTFAD